MDSPSLAFPRERAEVLNPSARPLLHSLLPLHTMVKISAVEGRPRLGPHLQDQLDRFLHLPDAGRWPRRELPAVLPVFILEKAGADAERQSSPAARLPHLSEMRGIAITDRRAKGGETDAAGDGGQTRQDGPAFEERLVGRAHAGSPDHVIHDREPDKAVILRPLRLRLHRLECLGRSAVSSQAESWMPHFMAIGP